VKNATVTSLALSIGLFIAGVGVAGAVTPDGLLAVARYAATPAGLYVVAALRVSVGFVLLRAAAASRVPKTLPVLGCIILVSGLITPLLGADRARVILDWWSSQGPAVIRLWAGLAFAFGVFVTFAVTPEETARAAPTSIVP